MLSRIVAFIFTICMVASVKAQVLYPEFTFYDLEGKVATSETLDRSKSTFIMQFDPYCDHCNDQAETIAKSAEQFQDVQFVFITFIPEPDAIQSFRDKHFKDTGLDVYFFQDLDFQFETYFGYTESALSIYLYKSGKRQPKFFGKEVPAETLLNYL
ncbi:MAG: hypothetical protein AAFV78_13720 [Bacteroidota bacterium]